MDNYEILKTEVEKIKQRNLRVETDKAWELSFARRTIILLGTYIFSSIFLVLINAPNALLTALVPACAYLLSTLTLPFFKNLWLKYRK